MVLQKGTENKNALGDSFRSKLDLILKKRETEQRVVDKERKRD